MTIHSHIRTLAAAALLALTLVSVSGGHADAKPRSPDNGVRCAVPGPQVGEDDVDWEFFLPGEEIVAYTSAGRAVVLRCGADGKWHRALLAASTGVQPVVAQPVAIAP